MSGWDVVKKALPFIATTLGGPLAGLAVEAIGSAVGMSEPTVEKVKQTLSGMGPEQIAQLTIAENELKTKLAQMGYDSIEKLERLALEGMQAVNATIQVEAKAEKWPVYSWRPFIGFNFGAYVGAQWILPLFDKQPVPLDPTLVTAIGAILGVASWWRGQMQTAREKK